MKSGLNWYQYCNSNPTTYVDPFGLFPTTIEEDNPFFYHKMESSEESGRVEHGLLEKIDSLDYTELKLMQSEQNLFRRLTREKLLSAEYLIFFMMNDPVYKRRMSSESTEDQDILLNKLIAGALANLVIEGNVGGIENPHYVSKPTPEYLVKSINYIVRPSDFNITETDENVKCGYMYWYDYFDGEIKNMTSVKIFDEFPQSYKEYQGFGAGMFQYTFERTSALLEVYKDILYGVTGDFTFSQKFTAEYVYFRNEMETGRQNSILNAYGENKEMGRAFREMYVVLCQDLVQNKMRGSAS